MNALFSDIAPLAFETHKGMSLDASVGYGFAQAQSVAPLVVREFAEAARDYALVFIGAAEKPVPVAVLGLRKNENLFVDAAGTWEPGRYIPATFRQYPFVISRVKGTERTVLGIDEAYSGFNRDGQGAALFDEDGSPSDLVENSRKFAVDMADTAARTERFCAKLVELDLLRPMRIHVEMGEGQSHDISGARAISRKALTECSDAALGELVRSGGMELIFQHLQSLRNLEALKTRAEVTVGKAPAKGDA